MLDDLTRSDPERTVQMEQLMSAMTSIQPQAVLSSRSAQTRFGTD